MCEWRPPEIDAGAPSAFDAGGPRSDAGSPAPPDAGRVCGPAICGALEAECGQVVDGCFTIIECGDCADGYRCGTDAFANRCQCMPSSCADLGANCGTVEDGCGVMMECGTCTSPQSCGGAGVENQCGCTPTPHTTTFALFRSAQNSDAGSGAREWGAVSNAVQMNSRGASFSVRGTCRWEGGGGDGCGCCTRTTVGNGTSRYLHLTNADVGLPADAVIRGIEVQVDIARSGTTVRLEDLSLVGPRTSSSRARSVALSSGFRRFTFGGPTDLWGETWTVAELTAANFGVRVQMSASASCNRQNCPSTTPQIDGAQVRIHYDGCE